MTNPFIITPRSIDHVSRGHRDYNFPLEVLCTLPRYPLYAAHKDLVADFALKNQKPLTLALETLRSKGFAIHTRNHLRCGRMSAILERSWPAAQKAGCAYWTKVNGNDDDGQETHNPQARS